MEYWQPSDDGALSRRIERGFEAYRRNTGLTHPSSFLLKRSTKRDGDSIPLIDDNGHLWYGPIDVGTPPVTFTGKSLF